LYGDKIGYIENIKINNINENNTKREEFKNFIFKHSKDRNIYLKMLPIVLEYDIDIIKKKKYTICLNKKFDNENFHNKIIRYSVLQDNKLYLTSDILIKNGFELEELPYNVNNEFLLFKINIPLFKFEEITNIKFLNHLEIEQTISLNENSIKYWLPPDISIKFKELKKDNFGNVYYRFPLTRYSFYQWMIKEKKEFLVQWILKEFGYSQKIYNSAISELKYKEYFIFGFKNDEENFINFSNIDQEFKNYFDNIYNIIK
jgi:hypothetical protein